MFKFLGPTIRERESVTKKIWKTHTQRRFEFVFREAVFLILDFCYCDDGNFCFVYRKKGLRREPEKKMWNAFEDGLANVFDITESSSILDF